MSSMRPKRVLIVGCGYVGLALGRRLVAAGHRVFGMRRSSEGLAAVVAAGIEPVRGDVTQPTFPQNLPGPFDWVVNVASSSRGGAADYREVYLRGNRNLVDTFAGTGLERLVYTSSTSVYGQADGAIVTEDSPAEPQEETGRVLLEAEQVLLEAFRSTRFPSVILRASGIYGPGRGYLFRQFVQGEARQTGDGSRCLNMIHREDLAGAIHHCLEHGPDGAVLNATDDCPATELEFFTWLAGQLGRPLPPPADASTLVARKRGFSSKRVANRRVRELGWTPIYPTFREGYAEPVAALRAGR